MRKIARACNRCPSWITPLFSEIISEINNIVRVTSSMKIYPDHGSIFRAFEEVPLPQVRGIFMGQSPYEHGEAVGLCFEYNKKVQDYKPRSYRVLEDHMGGFKIEWLKKSGFLMLNAALSIPAERDEDTPLHYMMYRALYERVFKLCTKLGIIVVLFGKEAQKMEEFVHPNSYVLKYMHPAARVEDPLEGANIIEDIRNCAKLKEINLGKEFYKYYNKSKSTKKK